MGWQRDENSDPVSSKGFLPPLSHRFASSVTEIIDTSSEERRVAVIDGPVIPPLGTSLTVFEDDTRSRTGEVSGVEIRLEFRRPVRVLVFAALTATRRSSGRQDG
jgi:hypothetical protein